jgi:MFS family permease
VKRLNDLRLVASANEPAPLDPPEVLSTRAIIAILAGTLVLRTGSAIAGGMIQFYFGYIDKSVYPLSNTMRGVALALFFLPELVGAPVLGAWSDRYGRKLFIQLAALCGMAGTIITGLTTNFALIIVMRLLSGLSTASQFPATLGYLSAATTHSESLRGRVMGLFEAVTLAGTIVGIFLSGQMWDQYGQNGFFIAGSIYGASFLIFALGLVEAKRKRKFSIPLISSDGAGRKALLRSLEYYREVLFEPAVLRFAPAWLAVNMILGIWMNHSIGMLISPRHPTDRFANQALYGILANSARAGIEVSTYGALLIGVFGLGVVIWSFILARWRRTSVMLVSIGALFALTAILFTLNHSSLTAAAIPVYLALAVLAFFVLSGAMPAALTYLADVTEVRIHDRGAIMGEYTILLGVGGFLGTLIGGPIADRAAIDGILAITIVLGITAAFALIQLHRFETKTPEPLKAISSEK